MTAPLFGILLVDKPTGATSHDVVQFVRWALHERAVGHFGTLDPSATGLLVIGVGPATRLGPYLTGLDKRYHARIVLGRATTTADAEGETIAEARCPEGTPERALDEARALVGTLHLAPPAVSAIRVDGQRAHARVRAGEDVHMMPREMIVHAAEGLSAGPGDAPHTVVVEAVLHVSKGTYVRSLAVELGRRLGLPAHLGALERRTVGSLGLHDPAVVRGLAAVAGPRGRARVVLPVEAGADAREIAGERLRAALRPPTTGLPMPVCSIGSGSEGQALARALQHGQAHAPGPGALDPPLPVGSGLVAITALAPTAPGAAGLLAIAHAEAGVVRPRRVIQPPAPQNGAAGPA